MEYWTEKWETKDAFWHINTVNSHLADYFNRILENAQSKPCRMFVPLCGKTVDLKWMYDQGHSVVGVEGVEEPIVDFFQEHSLPHVKGLESGIPFYATEDARLKIFHCNLFSLDPKICGTFDGIWDRGSLVAILQEDRQKYSHLLKQLQRENCSHLIVTIDYDKSQFSGPPRCVPVQEIEQLFGGNGSEIEILKKVDVNADPSGATPQKRWNVSVLEPCHEIVVLVTRRANKFN